VEVWEAVVELRERHNGQVDAVPVSVKRKHAYHSTLSLSPSAIALALGARTNRTQPAGSESIDLGLARSAAAQHPGGRDEL
jgi:hypothetical protein